MNNTQARRTARNAQVAGAALLLGAAGLLALPSDVWKIEAGGNGTVAQRPATIEKRNLPPLDAMLLAASLDAIAPEMAREKLPEVVENIETSPNPPTPISEPASTWRYIGGLFGGTVRKGIVVIGEDQRFVKAGDTVDKAFVVDVKPEYLTVDESGVRRYIPMAAKEKRVGTTVAASVNPMANVAANPMDAAAKASMMAVQAKERQALLDEKRRIASQLGAAGGGAREDRTPAEVARRLIQRKAQAAGRGLNKSEQAEIYQQAGAEADFEFMDEGEQFHKQENPGGN